jgi:antitoxin (DNA-binding transcriptional repressor) of toxin-antitoxin stability system
MISIGIRELRQHASRHVRMAKAGRRVAVTERGSLVAHLVPAADPRAQACLCLSSTVGPAECRHGVTDGATSTTSGGGLAWPRATHLTILRRVGVARCAPPTWRLARIKQRRPRGARCLKRH